MAKEIDGASSSGDSSKDNYDSTHWTKSEATSDGQVNTYVGKVGSDNHCHSYKTSESNSGVVHRGACKVCDDESNGNSGTGSQK